MGTVGVVDWDRRIRIGIIKIFPKIQIEIFVSIIQPPCFRAVLPVYDRGEGKASVAMIVPSSNPGTRQASCQK